MISMKSIPCPLINNAAVSPAVGIFWRAVPEFSDNVQHLGTIHRLGETLILTAPIDVALGKIIPDDGSFVMVGDIIADCTSIQAKNDSDNLTHVVKSPSDGFISAVDDNGKPFAEPGTRLKHGQIIAVLELMKIRMDIIFDGPDNAVFVKYLCPEKSTVQKNDNIFEYII